MPTPEELTRASVDLLTGKRAEMARWLALEVLILDEEVMADETLAHCLIGLQDRLTDQMTRMVPGRG